MATRLKTISYVFPMMTGSYAEGTSYTDSADLTVYIPETSGRTFKSCLLDVAFHDNQTTAGDDVAGISIRASCDAGSTWTTCTRTLALADTGENICFRVMADVTAEFVARFTGTSDTVRWGFYIDYATAVSSPVVTNVSAILHITYEWTDTGVDTRIKTVRIPLQGNYDTGTTAAGTTLANLGGQTNQIPALDTFLPESSLTYRAIFLEFWCNTCPINHTTDTAFEWQVGALTAAKGAAVEMGQVPYMNVRHTYDCLANSMPTNAAQTVQVRAETADAMGCVSAILYVTYEYSHTNSTTMLNSVVIPAEQPQDANFAGATGNDDLPLTFYLDIAEPGTITGVQSGIVWTGRAPTSGTANGITIKATGQTGTLYYLNKYVSSTNFGYQASHILTHRTDIDSCSWAPAAGMNRLTALVTVTAGSSWSNSMLTNALSILNYTSGKASAGDGAHNHSVVLAHKDITATAVPVEVSSKLVVVPETNPTLQGTWVTVLVNANTTTPSSCSLLTDGTELGVPASDVNIFRGLPGSGAFWNAENAWTYTHSVLIPSPYSRWMHGTSIGRFTSDPAVPLGVDPYATRTLCYGYHSTAVYYGAVLLWTTYHDVSYTVSGTVSGYTGDGSGITVEVWNKDEDWLEATTTTSVGGSYSTSVRTRDTVYAVARQDSTHCGRSDDGTGT